VPRDPALTITKVASATEVTPGVSFTYDIVVSNTSTLGDAYPVVLTDPIPANVRVSMITTSTTAFPRWTDCTITGADAGGFGGTLRCELFGTLGVSSSAPVVTLTAVARSTTTASIVNTATVCWSNPSNATQPQQRLPASATVTVRPGTLPPTGARSANAVFIGLALSGIGCCLVALARRSRRLA
jgi:uncharacterized repeat protein (TIGR01451 family)